VVGEVGSSFRSGACWGAAAAAGASGVRGAGVRATAGDVAVSVNVEGAGFDMGGEG
jgi:hypothetical protein